jgi:hypothetical protein
MAKLQLLFVAFVLRTKAEFLYGALHLSDSTSHNVAMRF